MALQTASAVAIVQRREKLNRALEQILHCLIAEYQPERVILFGSFAGEQLDEWSDLDLVIIKDTAQPFLQRLREVALLCRPTVGVDFLVYTPAEWEKMIAERNPFVLDEVLRNGRVLHERQPARPVAVARH